MKFQIKCKFYAIIAIIFILAISLAHYFFYIFLCEREVIFKSAQTSFANFLLISLLLLTGEILSVILVSKMFCKMTVNRIRELHSYIQAIANGAKVELKEDSYEDELSKLRQSIFDAYHRMAASRGELENNCQQLVETNQKLESNYIQAYNLQLIQEEISRELDIDKLVKKTADIIMGIFGSKRCLIYMADEENEMLVAKAFSGSMGKGAPKKTIAFNSKNIVARSWREKAIFNENDAKPEEIAELNKRNINSVLIVPLIGRQGRVGIMLLEHELAGGFNNSSVKFAKVVAQELSLSVENAYLYDKMRQMAIQDALTGVFNRLYLMTYMKVLFSNNPKTVSVLIFDMDHFKQVNDNYGHLTGDMVLKTTANLVQKMLPSGIIARYGGEEFVIVLPEVGEKEAVHFGNSIRQMIGHNRYVVSGEKSISVTISIGVANYPLVSNSYEGLLQLADKALYEAKNSGRNRVCVAKTDPGRT